jgi:Ca-activated chloride channel family protein
MRLKKYLIWLAMLLICPLLAVAEKGQVVMVLDASGSMWGQVQGKTKIEVAREVIGDLISNWDPDLHLGLIGYGHRKKGDCADIESIIEPGVVDSARFISAVHGLNPKGMTPLSDAVIQAAQQLRYTEQKATVILVSDGIETCEKDPCAVGEELEKLGVDFTAHVIGFDVTKKEEKEQLECLARNTGGQFFSASDAESLQQALEQIVEETVDPTGVQVRAVMKEGEPPLEENLAWEVYPAEKGGFGEAKQITYSYHATPIFHLDPGQYEIRVRHKSGSSPHSTKKVEKSTASSPGLFFQWMRKDRKVKKLRPIRTIKSSSSRSRQVSILSR